MDKLRNPPEGGWTTVANVRCLGEGVDVPAVDAVAFTNPKRSQVDIVQAVGRALRRNPDGSGEATIIVPIVIPDSAEEVGDLGTREVQVRVVLDDRLRTLGQGGPPRTASARRPR